MGTFIVLAILVAVVGLAIRSIWKKHRSHTGCSGNCANCGGGCH